MSSTSPKPLTSYQVLTSVLKSGIKPTDAEIKTINQFFFIRFLSSDPRSIKVANFFNCYYKYVPIVTQYNFAKAIIAGKISWIQYTPKEKNPANFVVVNNISRFYKISYEEAEDYFSMYNEEQREHFKTLYPVD